MFSSYFITFQGNILVDANGDVKLTDFGMSVSADGTPFNYGSQHGGGALRWTAPELMDGDEFGLPNRRPTRQSDVYSFACVCVEVRWLLLQVWVAILNAKLASSTALFYATTMA